MAAAALEHVNVTVSDPERTAAMLCDLFDWTIRWKGRSELGGNTVHVGSETDYLAVFAWDDRAPDLDGGRLNHVGVLVEDLDAVEERVAAAGLEPFNHRDYEPGRRFYFLDGDGIEYEVVSYS